MAIEDKGYGDTLVKLRQRMMDALRTGLVDERHHGLLQSTLIQIMNDAEQKRQSCMSQVEGLKRQIAVAEGMANGFAAVSSVVFNVIDGFIKVAERTLIEEQERARERESQLKAEQAVKAVEAPVVAASGTETAAVKEEPAEDGELEVEGSDTDSVTGQPKRRKRRRIEPPSV